MLALNIQLKTYEYFGWLHGVGISVVNALSKKLIVRVKKDGKNL